MAQKLNALRAEDYEAAGIDWQMRLYSFRDRTSYSNGMIVNASEVAAFFPLPSAAITGDQTYRLGTVVKTRAAPDSFHKPDGLFVGTNAHGRRAGSVYLSQEIRDRHVYLPGKTGGGKTTFMLNMIAQDLAAGHGLAVIDPEGSLPRQALRFVPKSRERDVVFFDAADLTHAVCYNLLDFDRSEPSNLDRRRNTLEKILDRTVGPFPDIMKRLLIRCLNLLLSVPGASLVDLPRLFTDDDFRSFLVAQCKHPDTFHFWSAQFPKGGTAQGSIDGICNRLAAITETPTVRDLTCQRESLLDFESIIAERKILLVDLNAEGMELLGQLLVSELQLAAFSRAEYTGPHFYVYCDEFQNFLGAGFDQILSRGRRRRIALTLAHQYIHQIGELAKSVLGNAGAIIASQLGVDDAPIISRDFVHVQPGDITNLPPYHAWAKCRNAVFTLAFPPPPDSKRSEEEAAAIVEASRELYAKPKALIRYDDFATEYSSKPRARRAPQSKPPRRPLDFDMDHEEI